MFGGAEREDRKTRNLAYQVDADACPLDICVDPSTPKQTRVSQVVETLMGKVARKVASSWSWLRYQCQVFDMPTHVQKIFPDRVPIHGKLVQVFCACLVVIFVHGLVILFLKKSGKVPRQYLRSAVDIHLHSL